MSAQERERKRRNVGRRVTDREKVSASDERYRQLVELAPDAILIHDGDRVVLANAAAVRLAGASSREQVVGQPIEAFLEPPYLKAVASAIVDSALPFAEVPPVRDAFRRVDGKRTPVEVTAIAFIDGGFPSVHLVIRDISERLLMQQAAQLTEERLHQAQRMEAVGALAGGVAHEVNNMMTVILGASEFLLRESGLEAGPVGEIEEIVRAADRAASITQQMLAFSRRAFHQPQSVTLADIARDTEPLLARLLREGHRLALTAETTPCVWADPAQLRQVLVNLALNARDAMPDGGTLSISTGEAHVRGRISSATGERLAPGHYAVLAVQDTGIGMDAAVRTRIFEPFFTTKPVGQGSGLGLAAVHGIIRQNRGHISVSSRVGHGARFTIYLPIHSEEQLAGQEAAPPVDTREAPRSGATILVVEDEPSVRAIAVRSLERAGFLVVQAGDGVAALELAGREGAPHLVLTDLKMPGMGGGELARRLRERWPDLPILFMSGYTEDELRQQGETGFEGRLVQKPFGPTALIDRVAQTLAHAS